MRVYTTILLIIANTVYPTQGNARFTDKESGNTMQMATPDMIQAIDGVQHVGDGVNRLLRTEADNEDSAEERGNWKGIFLIDDAAKKAAKEDKMIKKLAPKFDVWNKERGAEAVDLFGRIKSKGFSDKEAVKMGNLYTKYLENPLVYY